MALGKNLKKKKVIPDKSKKKSAAKPKPKTKPNVKKKTLIPKEKKLVIKKPSVKKPLAIKAKADELVNFITTEEQERRQSLQKKFAQEIKELANKSTQFVIFKLGQQEYAIDISKVKEVVATPEISKVPKMPDYIKGLADIRGKTVMLIDLTIKFELGEQNEFSYTLVIEGMKQPVGLLLNELPLALKVEGKNITSTMTHLTESSKEENYVKGLIKLDKRLIYYLDMDELLKGDKAVAVPNHLKA